jgi:hypothetical protein
MKRRLFSVIQLLVALSILLGTLPASAISNRAVQAAIARQQRAERIKAAHYAKYPDQDPANRKEPEVDHGTQVTSKTLWQDRTVRGRNAARVDVENPNPGQRPGQIHYQQGREKYLYDAKKGEFYKQGAIFRSAAPKAVNEWAKTAEGKRTVQKGLDILGLDKKGKPKKR